MPQDQREKYTVTAPFDFNGRVQKDVFQNYYNNIVGNIQNQFEEDDTDQEFL